MAKNKYYVVWQGRLHGIYTDWDTCSNQVKGFQGAQFKGYPTREAAEAAFRQSYEQAIAHPDVIERPSIANARVKPEMNSLSVDAACSGVPGPVEYRGVWTATGEEVFRQGPFPDGTNNIGEFLAIVHGVAWLKQRKLSLPVYSDSKTALCWIRQKKCNTKHPRSARNAQLFDLVQRAENWLHNNRFDNPVLKWETEIWGETPADFGRK